eukprot:763482-Hanusia_phi.AAC.12
MEQPMAGTACKFLWHQSIPIGLDDFTCPWNDDKSNLGRSPYCAQPAESDLDRVCKEGDVIQEETTSPYLTAFRVQHRRSMKSYHVCDTWPSRSEGSQDL